MSVSTPPGEQLQPARTAAGEDADRRHGWYGCVKFWVFFDCTVIDNSKGRSVNARGRTQFAPTEKDREHENSLSFFHTPCPARYSVLHLLGVLSGDKIAFLWEEGGTR